ncbi:hypothetical protein C8P66_1217 [Humitalea rosea]|uniref:Tetratricopeptide repeat protein n=1 Tax=Humitalea rosea TaxID=990373 RepID=A0A2W7K132_9PROT|nr:hypothetical protein [Humitalea rosea]PZW41300.1 hypothetical protein C8P66_1217 [Humitalea rosea]
MRRLVALLLLLSGPLLAETPDRIAVRVGDHPGHGRIVLDWPRQVVFRSERDGTALRLFFTAPEAVDVAGARRPPRNVRAVATIPGGVEITLAPGVEPRVFRLGGRIVIDALNASATDAAPAVEAPAPAPAPPARRLARAPAARPAPAIVPVAAEPAPVPVVTATPLPPPGPVSPARVATVEPPPAPRSPAAIPLGHPAPGVFLLTLTPPPAVAVLRRGGEMLVLFDRALPLDLAALRADPLLEPAVVAPLPGAVLLRLPVAEGAGLRATRAGDEWRFEVLPVAAAPAPMRLDAAPGPPARLALQAAMAGRVVALTDPLTGLPMLVGTMLGTGEGPGQGMPQGRRLPEAEMLPSLLGLAVLARAETVTLVALTDRFLLGAGPDGLRLGPAAGEGPPAAAAAMTRSFDIPGGTAASLSERLRAQGAGLAVAAPLTRGPLRLAAAETLMALGQPQEAQAMLAIALQEDPRAGRDARIIALQAAAALLSGRLSEAAALATTTLAASDEATLWRAVLAAARGEAATAAPGIAASLPLLAAYPEPLRLRLLPHAAEALVEGGAPAAAERLLQDAPDLPALRLVRARLNETQGHLAEALAGYDEVARGRDRLARAEALRRSVELRLQTGALDAAGAAAALDAALFAWRGDGREIAARERVAALQLQAGAPRAALALLQESATLFPDRAEALRPAIATAFLAALEAEPALAAAALFETERALLPDGPAGTRALARLAGRLAAMELGDRAGALLIQAMARADAPARAALGLRLAMLRLEDRDAAGALTALEESRATGLDPVLVLERARIQARALAAHADLPGALALLRGLGLPGADLVAELLAEAQDWPGAATALGDLVAALPAGPLGAEPQRLLLRAAAAALLAGEEARTAALAAGFAERMAETPLALAFARLTGDPATALLELPRLTRELDLFRNPPARLEALRAGGPVAR